jgi:hypothetical protein
VSNGAFSLWRVERASWTWTNLIGWTPSPAIRTGTQSNRLKVVRSGASIALYVNETLVGSTSDGVYTGTWLGIKAGAAAANFDGRFDNFAVYGGDCTNPSADLMSPGLPLLPRSYGTDCEVDRTQP